MNWINFFFYVIVLNSLTGTVAYLLCNLLALVAKKYNAIWIIYPLYRLVLLFYIVPLGCILSGVSVLWDLVHMPLVMDFLEIR